MNLNNEITREVRRSITTSILIIAAGILAIIAPHVSGIAAAIVIAGLLVVVGAFHLAFAWQMTKKSGFWWETMLGLLYVATGGYMLLQPSVGLATLTILLAAWLFIEAFVEFILAFHFRPARGWGWLVLDGVITLILGVLICLTWPASANWLLGTLVGISMLFSGTARLMLSLAARDVVKAIHDEAVAAAAS